MSKRLLVINVYLLALVFTLLFYKQSLGFNLLIFEVILFIFWAWSLKLRIFVKPLIYVWFGTIISAIAVAMHGSFIAKSINLISLFLLNGFLVAPHLRSVIDGLYPALENSVAGPFNFVKNHSTLFGNGKNVNRVFKYLKITLVPLLVLVVFATLYSYASSFFGEYMSNFLGKFSQLSGWFSKLFSSGKFWMFISGLVISSVFLIHKKSMFLFDRVANKSDELVRIRKQYSYRRNFKMNALNSERKAGVFLFILLNLLILFLNILDLQHVWFSFEWNQQYLKEFVHGGTYILIFSILIAILVVLFYFRNNLNFIQKNGLLKKLAIIWSLQNVFLALSVGMRNFWYIKYYNLAYLRIGVIFFLIIVIFGLLMLIRKINERKTSYFLIRKTSLAFYISLIGLAVINWDPLIAKFNFSRHQEAFIHFDFMANLSSKALPLLDRNEAELSEMESFQVKGWGEIRRKNNYIGPVEFKAIIDRRISSFVKDYNEVHWLSKNWSTVNAHHTLKSRYGDLGDGNNRN